MAAAGGKKIIKMNLAAKMSAKPVVAETVTAVKAASPEKSAIKAVSSPKAASPEKPTVKAASPPKAASPEKSAVKAASSPKIEELETPKVNAPKVIKKIVKTPTAPVKPKTPDLQSSKAKPEVVEKAVDSDVATSGSTISMKSQVKIIPVKKVIPVKKAVPAEIPVEKIETPPVESIEKIVMVEPATPVELATPIKSVESAKAMGPKKIIMKINKKPAASSSEESTPAGSAAPSGSSATPASTSSTKMSELDKLILKMPGVNIDNALSSLKVIKDPQMDDILIQDTDEDDKSFEIRKKFTLAIIEHNDYNLSNNTAITVARILLNKANMGGIYEKEVEDTIAALLMILQ